MEQRKRRERNSGLGYYTSWEKGRDCGCIYCGAKAETREHIPTKSLLIEPYPDNLPTVPACFKCNNGFSADEEYFLCFLESLKKVLFTGFDYSVRVVNLFKKKPHLERKIQKQISKKDGDIVLSFETERFVRIINKLAVGHAGYEYDDINFYGAKNIWFDFAPNLSDEEKSAFDEVYPIEKIPEISSRFSCNAFIAENIDNGEIFIISDWIVVQSERYEYYVYINNTGGVSVKIKILDLLYCKIDFD